MRIYHYTNIDTLALILHNKTIRFNRLDKVDDIEEGEAESLGVKFCKYVFASCWTENPAESIPLWKMYSGDSGGIRFSIEYNMFKEYYITNLNLNGLKTVGSLLSKIPPQDMESPDYFFLNITEYNNDFFFRRIKYVDNVFEYTKDAFKIININGERSNFNLEIKPFGYYKSRHWEFQNESRFVLFAFPFNPLLESEKPDISAFIIRCIQNNKQLPFTYYDMHLKEDAFDSVEITLGPSVTETQRNQVFSLVEKYAPCIKINDSYLKYLVRLK